LQLDFKAISDVSAVFTIQQTITASHSVTVQYLSPAALDSGKASDKVSHAKLFIGLSYLPWRTIPIECHSALACYSRVCLCACAYWLLSCMYAQRVL